MPLRSVERSSTARRFIGVYHGIFVIVAALAVGIIGWLMLRQLAANIQENPHSGADLPSLAAWLVANRGLLPFLMLPPILAAVMAMLPGTRSAAGCLLQALAVVWLLAILAVVLFTFVSYVAPMYQYQPL